MELEEIVRMNMSLLQDVVPIDVDVKDLLVVTKTGKSIISNVNLSFKAGQVIGIMGSSGSGKTTLLNSLCGRAAVNLDGKILFNNSDAEYYHRNRMTAYVQQNDFLMPYLTVRECLQYTAELRLGKSQKEKYRIVQDVILELGLKDCADTIIGDDWRKGISGGEKRRVSVAVQLLVNPSLIFLDEPTTGNLKLLNTGLDSFTANNLIKTLVDLAKRGRTVFISIHQPRSDIYQLFDSIVLLSKGRIIYSGPGGEQMIDYFDKLGHQVPLNANPADFFIDVVSVDTRDQVREKETNLTVDRLIQEWEKYEKTKNVEESSSLGVVVPSDAKHGKVEPVDDNQEHQFISSKKGVSVNYFQQTWVLFRRALTNLKRDNLAVWGNLFEVLLFGSLLGAIFYKLDEDLPGVLSRRSALYIVASMQTYLMLIFIIYKLSNDMKVYDRERADNMYGAIPYMIAQFFSTLPFNILFPLIYSSIMVTYFSLTKSISCWDYEQMILGYIFLASSSPTWLNSSLWCHFLIFVSAYSVIFL